MFRKKQKPPLQARRNVSPQQSANVFSYRASRAPSDGANQRRMSQKAAAPKKQKRNTREWLALVPSLFAGVALLLCLGYILTLDTNAKIHVVGDQRELGLMAGIEAYEAGVQEVFASSFANQSKLLINTDAIADDLREKYPELGDVAVVLPFIGRRPVVQVQPARPALVLGTTNGGFVVDETGRIIADAEDADSSIRDKLPALQDESGLQLERGNYALKAETVRLIQEVALQLQDKDIEIQTMTLPTTPNELHVRVAGKPYFVKFNLRGEGREQAGAYIATKEKLEADGAAPRQYIDVRVPGKAYYK